MSVHLKAEKIRAKSVAYDQYQHARAHLLPIHEARVADEDRTAAEHELLAELDELWQADATTIGDLRRYGKTTNGIRRSNYKGERADAVRPRLERDRLKLLENGDPALWVDEPSVLGGFGLQTDRAFYNEDTLRFFRIVSLLNDAALIAEFRPPLRRATIWEIGGGWGGFAHYVKRLFPDLTYLISAPPTLLLLSATYLMTLFPDSRFRFFEPGNPAAFWHDWDTVDFAFAPDTALAGFDPDHVVLTVDIGMLERMSPFRIDAHVQRAFDLNCRYVLSLCGEDHPERTAAVRAAIEQRYWLHPMSVPRYLDRRFSVRRGEVLLGWKRLRT